MGNRQIKFGQVAPSIATRILFNSDENGKCDRLKYVFFIFGDGNYMIHTHHAWPSEMHSNLLICAVKILAIPRVLTLQINKFWCIYKARS